MINPIDRTTKKISIRDIETGYNSADEMYRDNILGMSTSKIPVSPNRKQLYERIRQHMIKESVY